MLFIFYLISKLFEDGQVVCACVQRVNEREACTAGAIENRRNLALFFFFSFSFLGDRVPLPNVSLKASDCFFCCCFCGFICHFFGHLNATCCLLCNQTFTRLWDRRFVGIPLSLSQLGPEVELEPRGTGHWLVWTQNHDSYPTVAFKYRQVQ